MKTIVVMGQKGGSGKTTLAINLAVAAHMQGDKVVLLDADPQKSAIQWAGVRKSNQIDQSSRRRKPISVQATLPHGTDADLRAYKRLGYTLAIVDTPPHLTPSAHKLADFADLVIIPCRPTALDLGTLEATTRIVRASGKAGLVVLSANPPRSGDSDPFRHALRRFGLGVAPVSIGERVAFARSISYGRGVLEEPPYRAPRASAEMMVLWDFVGEVLDGRKAKFFEKAEKGTRNQ